MRLIKPMIFLLSMTSIVLLVFIFGGFYLLISAKNEFKRAYVQFNRYQYIQLNSHKNQTSFGIVTLSENLEEEEYFSLKISSTEHLLISNIGSNEYRCTGTCFCEDKERTKRRNSISIVIRNVLYLVSAISSIVAYQKASEYYEKECMESLESDGCHPHSIHSSVDDCETVTSVYYVDEEYRLRDGEKMYKFLCEGKCSLRSVVPIACHKWHEALGDEGMLDKLGERREDCENLKYVFPESIGGVDDKSALDKALRSFAAKLRDYCEVNSVVEEKYESLFYSLVQGGDPIPFSWCTYNPKVAVGESFEWDEKKNRSPKPVPPYAKCRSVI